MSAQKYFGLAGLYTFRSKTWQVRWNCIILVVVLFRETRTHIWTAMPQNMHPSTKCNKCFDCQNRGYILFCKSNECKKIFYLSSEVQYYNLFDWSIHIQDISASLCLWLMLTSMHMSLLRFNLVQVGSTYIISIKSCKIEYICINVYRIK